MGSVSGSGRSPGGEHGNPLQYSCLGNPMDGDGLVGYNPWSCKELDMTEQLIPMHTHSGILLSHKNESDFVICSNTDGL